MAAKSDGPTLRNAMITHTVLTNFWECLTWRASFSICREEPYVQPCNVCSFLYIDETWNPPMLPVDTTVLRLVVAIAHLGADPFALYG